MIYFDDILKAIEFCNSIKDQYEYVSCKAVVSDDHDIPGVEKIKFVVEYR